MLSFLAFFAYAATFYRFKYFFSYLKKRTPVIVADIPHRVHKEQPLPVLIVVKNADTYPITLISCKIIHNGQVVGDFNLNKRIKQNYADFLFNVDVSHLSSGFHSFDIKISYQQKKKIYTFYNDNYRGTSRAAIPCYISTEPLPAIGEVAHCDMHVHSNYTDDQIEFGASVGATQKMAAAIGLKAIAITDHSYDLDDYEDNYLKNDPSLAKWKKYLTEMKHQAKEMEVFPIIGEEVSAQNSKKRNIHLLVYNSPTYFAGNGDSGEKWFHYYSENSIADVAEKAPNRSVLFAAHPCEPVPFLERLLLNRDGWHNQDVLLNKVTGVQIFNGQGKKYVRPCIDFWVHLLLSGSKKYILGGNDSHGNFGRNRAIDIPFISIKETYTQLLGKWRTDFYNWPHEVDNDKIARLLKAGNYSVSSGPALHIYALDKSNRRIHMGVSSSQLPETLHITVRSTQEFGAILSISVIFGDLKKKKEEVYFSLECPKHTLSIGEIVNIAQTDTGYFRVEAKTIGPKGTHFAFSNPIWFSNT